MSDELPAGTLSLEEPFEGQASLTPPEAETPPAAQPAAEIPEEDAEPEGTVEIPTGKVVPLTALQAERAAKKQEREAREAAERVSADAKQKLDVIQREWNAVQPLIQQLRSQPPPPAPVPKGPLNDQEAVEYARDLDLYKPDGTPDVDRAQRLAAKTEALAERKTQAAIQPFQQQTATTQSAALFEQAANLKDKTGQTVDRGILQTIWSQVPADMSARPEVATILHRVAIAESLMQGRYRGSSAPPPPAPLHTEGLGGGGNAKPEPTAIDRRFMDASEIGEKEFTSISARYKPGQRNVLE